MLPANRNNSALTVWTAAPTNRLDRLFDSLFEEGALNARKEWPGVPVSLWRDQDNIYVEADLPGVTEQDLELTVHNGILFIRGERKAEADRRYVYNGRAWGRFERVINLPEKVQADGVQADLSNGVLRVVLPVSPETKPKNISVKAK